MENMFMGVIEKVLDTNEKEVFDLMFTKKEFEKWLAKNNLEFNTENLKKYKDYCIHFVLENVWLKMISIRNEAKRIWKRFIKRFM